MASSSFTERTMADEPDVGELRKELVTLAEISTNCQRIYEKVLKALKNGEILPLCAQPLLQQHLEPVNNMSVIKMVENRLEQMEKREIAVLVTGEFNSGKSTFVNILMGGQYLPMDRGKVTHVVCEIRHSSDRMAVLKFEDKRDDEFIALEEDSTCIAWKRLRECIRTKVYKDDHEVERIVERIVIFWPLQLLEGIVEDNNDIIADHVKAADADTRQVIDDKREDPDGRSRTSSDFPQQFLDRLKPHARSFDNDDQAENRDPDQTFRKEIATSSQISTDNSDIETSCLVLPQSNPIAIEGRTQGNMGLNVPTGGSLEFASDSASASYQSNNIVVGACDTNRQITKEDEYASDSGEVGIKVGNGHLDRQRSEGSEDASETEDGTSQTHVKEPLQQVSAEQVIYDRRKEAAGNGNISPAGNRSISPTRNENISLAEEQVASLTPTFQFVFLDCPGIDLQDDEKDSPEYAGMVDEVERCQSFIFVIDTNRDTGVKKRGVKSLMEDIEKDFRRRNMNLSPDLSLFVANKADEVIGCEEKSERLLEDVLQKLAETWPLTRKEQVLLFQANKELKEHIHDKMRKIQDFVLRTMRITLEEHCIWLLRMLEIAHTMAKLGQESSQVVHRLDYVLQKTAQEAIELQDDVLNVSDVDARRKAWKELGDILLRNESDLQTIQWNTDEIKKRIKEEDIDWGELIGFIHILIGEKVEAKVKSAAKDLRAKHAKDLDEIYRNIEIRMKKLQQGISGLEEMERDEAHLRNGIIALLAPAVISVSIRAAPVVYPFVFMAVPIIPLGLFGQLIAEDIQESRSESKRTKFRAHKAKFMQEETNRILNIAKKALKGKGEVPESPLFTYFFGESRKKSIYANTENVIKVIQLLQEMTCNKSEPSQKCSKKFIVEMMKFYVERVMKHEFTETDDIKWVFNKEGIRRTIDQGRNACTYEAIISDRFEFKKPVAVKEFRCKLEPSDVSTSLPAEVDAYRECFYLRQLSTKRHDKLVNFLGTGTSKTDGYFNLRIVMERYIGDLKRHVISIPRSSSLEKNRNEFLHYARECTDGLNFIHENNVIHRDVKPSNFLIKKGVGPNGQHSALYSVVISDVGCAKSEEANCTRGQETGTRAYWAPEISLANTFHSKASDVFSLGLVLWEIWTRQLSYSDSGRNRDLLRVAESEKIPVIKKCLRENPKDRITSAELLAELQKISN